MSQEVNKYCHPTLWDIYPSIYSLTAFPLQVWSRSQLSLGARRVKLEPLTFTSTVKFIIANSATPLRTIPGENPRWHRGKHGTEKPLVPRGFKPETRLLWGNRARYEHDFPKKGHAHKCYDTWHWLYLQSCSVHEHILCKAYSICIHKYTIIIFKVVDLFKLVLLNVAWKPSTRGHCCFWRFTRSDADGGGEDLTSLWRPASIFPLQLNPKVLNGVEFWYINIKFLHTITTLVNAWHPCSLTPGCSHSAMGTVQ